MMRIVITGYPNSGKSTLAAILAKATGWNCLSTDILIPNHSWSEVSAEAAKWLDKPGPWILEGVAMSRAIRKWRTKHPFKKPPLDIFVYIRRPHAAYRPGQRAMANGMETVMLELWKWMDDNGVSVYRLGPGPDEEAE